MLVNFLLAENIFSRESVQFWTRRDFIESFVRHADKGAEVDYVIAPHHRRGKRSPTALCVIDTSDIA